MKKRLFSLLSLIFLLQTLNANSLEQNQDLKYNLKNIESFLNHVTGDLIKNPLYSQIIQNRGNSYPSMDIYDIKKHYIFLFELPNMKKKDIHLSINDEKTLVIKGNKPKIVLNKKDKIIRVESFVGTFKREIVLPKNVDTKKIDVSYKNGILKVSILKKEEATLKYQRVIPIK
jgi:HSP20 family protein